MSSSSISKHSEPSPVDPRFSGNGDAAESALMQSVLSGGGEMGALMRGFDWSKTPLGAVSQWPQSLRIAVRILLGTGYPMLICWGSQYTMIYNDGYRPILGKTKHPAALGSPIGLVFTEAMDFIGPRFDNVMARGEDFTVTDQLFILDRNDYVEECYFTFSYSPAPADDGSVGGVLVTALETTERVLDDRRRRILRDLATDLAKTHSEQEVWLAAATTLVSDPLTVPFAALYSYQSTERVVRLVACAGGTSAAMCPPIVDLKHAAVWPFDKALTNSSEVVVSDLPTRFADSPPTSWGVPPDKAVVLPIILREHPQAAGFLVAGISPRRELDEQYRHFLQRSAEQIATGLASARAYEEERRRAEALAEIDRAKTLFFSNVSHEFRTPLTLMLGPLEELAAKGASRLGGEEHQQVDVARRNALRLLKLVNTLLDFSRIEAGRVQAAYEQTDLCTLTAEIASTFRSVMEKAGLRFSVQCEPIDEPIYADRDMWEKIVLNLLSNAFKFTFEGEVAISLKPVNGWVELAVRDTGIGIAKEEQARVFERFHRVENTRARTYEGTGIGLALVDELVRLHGGTVRVESTFGQGSTFTVTIPTGTAHLPADRVGAKRTLASTSLSADAYVDEAERWLPHVSARVTEEETLRSERPASLRASDSVRQLIVIADDNADMREYLAHLLRDEYEVHAVADGKQAFEAARTLHPALLLADVMMPEMDGFAVLNAIRSDTQLRSTPVILLSARAGEESRVEGLQAGADDYLVKPFTARELIARVSAHLNMAKLRREAAEKESRLRAEAERERRRLQELLAQAPAAIGLLSGPEHRWVYVNQNYVRVTGRASSSDFVGKTIRESLPEIETQPFIDLLDTVYRTGKPYIGREAKAILRRSHTGQSDEAYFDFVYQPVTDGDGKVEGILVHAVEVTDKVIARNEINETAERLQLAQSAAQIGTWEWDPLRDFRRLSPELHRLFGTDADDPEHAQKWAQRVHPEDFNKVQECMTEGHRSGDMDFEYRYLHPHLGLKWFYCKGRRFSNETRMFGIIQDITERKKAEEALAVSEKKYRDLAETATIALHWVGPDGTILWANKAELDMLGYTAEEYIGRNITQFHVDGPVIDDILNRLCKGQRLHEYEARLRAKDGTIRHVIIDSSVLFEEGKFVHTRCFTRDITERKLAEEALRQSEERYRAMIATTPECVKLVAADGTLLDMNSAGLEMVGADCADMVVGKNVYDVIAPEDRDRFRDFNERICSGQRGSLEFDIVGVKGVRRHVETHAAPLRSGDGSTLHLAVTRDVTDRRLAEQALREGEQKLRVVTEATPVMIWMSGTDKLCFYFNKSWLDFVGRTLEQEMGNGWAENVHPDDFDRCLQIYVTSFDARRPFEMEYRLRHHSGQYRWILDHGVPRYTADGKFEGYVGGCLDIHEQKEAAEKLRQASEALRTSEERFRALVTASSYVVYRMSPDWRQMWQLDGRGFVSDTQHAIENWLDVYIQPDDQPKVLAAIRAAIDNKTVFELEHRVRRADGSLGWTLSRAVPLLDREGNIVEWFGAASDVTARREAEEAQRRLAVIVKSSDDAIISKDLNGTVTSWNPAAEKMFGYSAKEMVGRSIATIIPPELQHDEQTILAAIGRGETIDHFDTVRLTKGGERIHVSVTISPIRDEAGNVVGAAKIARDITREKQAEQALRTTERLAAVGRLAATVAHEINNPLAAVTNLVYLSRQRAVRQEIREFLASAEEELQRIAHLTKQTLGFYRESKTPIAMTLGSVVQSTISVFTPRTRNKGITIQSDIKQDPEFHAGPSEIRQLVGNLLSNSIDAVENGGQIRIRVSTVSRSGLFSKGVRLTVADSGSGIPDEVLGHIFEPFFTTKKDVGTGLGLWICKGIVERYSGSIKVRSSTVPGRSGTVVSIVLPISHQEQALTDALRQAV